MIRKFVNVSVSQSVCVWFVIPEGNDLKWRFVCTACQCNYTYSTGNCEDGDGQCECKDEYTKPNCGSCSFGYDGFPWCKACECHLNGTRLLQCNPVNGSCACKENFSGELCRSCADGYYHFPECKGLYTTNLWHLGNWVRGTCTRYCVLVIYSVSVCVGCN